MHRITDNRVAGENLRVFQKLCGRDALNKVYLTTTMWDEVEPSVGERRLADLKTEYWRRMIAQGAQVACCRSDDDSPKTLVRQIVMFLTPQHIVPVSHLSTDPLRMWRNTASPATFRRNRTRAIFASATKPTEIW